MSEKFKLFFDYLFDTKKKLTRKFFLIHFFLDTLIILILTLAISWPIAFFILLITNAPITVDGIHMKMGLFTGILLTLLIVLNKLSVIIRRLNDLKLNRWLSVLLFVPIVNLIFNLFLFFKKSED